MRHSNKSLSASKDEVVSSFKSLISGAEDLLRSTAHASGEGADTARRNFRAYVESARDTLHEVEGAARKSYRQASDSTHLFVRGNPWQAVGIAVAAGLLVGLFAGRRAD